jgi:hypothetical protein
MTKSTPSSRQTRRAATTASRSGLSWPLIFGIGGAVALIAVVAVAVYNTQQARNVRTAPIEGVQTFPSIGKGHTTSAPGQDVSYEENPPVGGAHDPTWQNCGVYDQPIFNKHAVHSLEHGAVWITYQPEVGAEAIARLKSLVGGRDYTLLSPYPGLPSPVVISAWGVQLKVESADDPRLETFIRKYMQGAQTPEPGATCFSGTNVVKSQ